jgi:predicted ATPase with chaperone activity
MAHVESSCAKGSRRAALAYKRIPVNLAPADMPKDGSHYDLPGASPNRALLTPFSRAEYR